MNYIQHFLRSILIITLLPSFSIAQWMYSKIPFRVTSLIAAGSTILAGTNGGGIYRSTDNGATWMESNHGMLNNYITGFMQDGAALYTATKYAGVYKSTDGGVSWAGINMGQIDLSVTAIGMYGKDLIAGAGGALYRNSGDSTGWKLMRYVGTVEAIGSSGPNLFVGTQRNGIYLTSDNGTGWMLINNGISNDLYVTSIVTTQAGIFAGCGGGFGGVFRLNANGTSWTAFNAGMRNTNVTELCASGTTLFAYLSGAGIVRSLDNGNSWAPLNTGIADDRFIYALAASDTYLFAGNEDGIYRNRLDAMTTSVGTHFGLSPTEDRLDQNYPNPFNPSSTISFHIGKREFVRLTIVNALGQTVTTLAAEDLSVGDHTRQWDASGVPSGVYFYRIQAGAWMQTRSMQLIK